MLNIHSVLWPTDGSDASFRALPAVIGLCRQHQAKLYIIQVVAPVPTMGTGVVSSSAPAYYFDARVYEQELIKVTDQQLHSLAEKKIPAEIDYEVHVLSGTPADTINQFSERHGVDVVVMATHGRTGLSHLMLGSVTERTIRKSKVPVLIIPAYGQTADD